MKQLDRLLLMNVFDKGTDAAFVAVALGDRLFPSEIGESDVYAGVEECLLSETFPPWRGR